ncbi:MAG: hypothetical protein ACM3PC_07930 [Deltaproteobacteria bacterium]
MLFGDLHERREDVLTSSAFGLLRYITDETGIFAFLRLVQRVTLVADEVPEKEMKKEILERVAIYEFALAPERHSEAVCLCVAASFKKPTAFDDFSGSGESVRRFARTSPF